MLGLGVLVVAMILCCLFADGISEDDESHAATKEAQPDFATVDVSDGSWAQVYREARGDEKEALELLFRCNIISTEEFAFSSVSQEHIQECIWIATHMLRQKPLEEWVALWGQAQRTFEDSVTACFEARGGPYSSFSSSYPPMPASNLSLSPVPLSARSGSSRSYSEVGDDPYTTRGQQSPRGASLQDPMLRGLQSPNYSTPPTPHSGAVQDSRQFAEARDRIPDSSLQIPDTQTSQTSQNTAVSAETERSQWSIESELDRGLALHGLK